MSRAWTALALGVVLAFLVQTLVAVTAGGLLALLPEQAVAAGTALLFAIGSYVLLRGAARADREAADEERELTERLGAEDEQPSGAAPPPATSALRAIGTSFGVLFLAEWGDLSQLLTISLVAKYDDPLSVFLGAWGALLAVSGLAVIVGRLLLQRVRLAPPTHHRRDVVAGGGDGGGDLGETREEHLPILAAGPGLRPVRRASCRR